MELLLANHRELEKISARLPRVNVFDGTARVVIEAQSQDDALYLCIEMGWELIRACED